MNIKAKAKAKAKPTTPFGGGVYVEYLSGGAVVASSIDDVYEYLRAA